MTVIPDLVAVPFPLVPNEMRAGADYLVITKSGWFTTRQVCRWDADNRSLIDFDGRLFDAEGWDPDNIGIWLFQ